MTRHEVLRCECGFEARAESEGELVAAVQRHAWEGHGMALSDDEALLIAFRAALNTEASTVSISRQATARPKEEP